MNIRKVNVSRLIPASYNPRVELQPDDEEYKNLKRSIDTFGYVTPIVWNERTGNVVGGQQRLNVLIAKGYKEIEVSCIDVSEDEEKALNVALNKISGQWDVAKLEDILRDIQDSEIDILVAGFSQNEINDILSDFSIDDLDSFFVEKTPEENKYTSAEKEPEIYDDGSNSLIEEIENEPNSAKTDLSESEEDNRIQCPECGNWFKP